MHHENNRIKTEETKEHKFFTSDRLDGKYRDSTLVINDRHKPYFKKKEVENMLVSAMKQMGLSARAYHRIMKVARTLADLDGATRTGRIHVAEAISYRIAGERLASAA